MAATVVIQIVVMLIAAALFWFFAGRSSAISALLGGFSYIVPTIFTVLVLSVFKPFPGLAGMGFLLGEGLKIVLALILMLLVFYFYHQHIVFVPFLLGMVSVSHLVFLISWKVQRNGK